MENLLRGAAGIGEMIAGMSVIGVFSWVGVSGLEWTLDTVEIEQLNQAGNDVVIQGMSAFDVTMRRPVYVWDDGLWEWIKAARVGNAFRKDLLVVLLKAYNGAGWIDYDKDIGIDLDMLADAGLIPVRGWYLRNCVPTSRGGLDLDSSNTEIAIDEITVHVKDGVEVNTFGVFGAL